jgi:hypothetical protein
MTKSTIILTLFILTLSAALADEGDTTRSNFLQEMIEVVTEIKAADYGTIDDYAMFPMVTNCGEGQNYSSISKNDFIDNVDSLLSDEIVERLIDKKSIEFSMKREGGETVEQKVKIKYDYIEYDVVAQIEIKVIKNIVLYFKQCNDKLRLEKYICDEQPEEKLDHWYEEY